MGPKQLRSLENPLRASLFGFSAGLVRAEPSAPENRSIETDLAPCFEDGKAEGNGPRMPGDMMDSVYSLRCTTLRSVLNVPSGENRSNRRIRTSRARANRSTPVLKRRTTDLEHGCTAYSPIESTMNIKFELKTHPFSTSKGASAPATPASRLGLRREASHGSRRLRRQHLAVAQAFERTSAEPFHLLPASCGQGSRAIGAGSTC